MQLFYHVKNQLIEKCFSLQTTTIPRK